MPITFEIKGTAVIDTLPNVTSLSQQIFDLIEEFGTQAEIEITWTRIDEPEKGE